jgi:cobalt-zinc-cadmium efflux system membrane fusion protein
MSREAALHSTRAQLTAATQSLAIERQQLSSQMSTQQSVAAAQSALAAATAAFDTAQGELQVAQQMSTVRAPSSGTVLAVSVTAGERVAGGETILTLQPAGRLWLTASYYGRDLMAVHVGMSGAFQPAEADPPVPVKVVSVAATLGPDGGERVGMVPSNPSAPGAGASPAPWLNGEGGTVALEGPMRTMIVIPTDALILDQGRWWVLKRSTKGDRPQQVVPGPTRGWQTFIEQGLKPGERVVVANAYLEFHRGISQQYQPPDQ